MEVDASGQGVGAILMQDHHPMYISRIFNLQQQAYSTNKKELVGVVFAVQKWRHYLLNRHFTIKTDHYSLKYILDQRWTTEFQQKWLVKLMEFDFTIEYRRGKENVVANALSRKDVVECKGLITLQLQSELIQEVQQSWITDIHLQKLITELKANTSSHKHYTWENNELRRKGKLVVGIDGTLRKKILQWLHASAEGGHSGMNATVKRVKAVVYWKALNKDIKHFIQRCSVCQQNKYDTTATPDLL